MSKLKNKHRDWKHLNVRVPPQTGALIEAAAQAKGIDVSAMLNWILSEACPALEKIVAGRAILMPATLEEAA